MAEALVFMSNNTHPDSLKSERSCWKRGMIVVLKEDGHLWGREENPALLTPPRRFMLLKFPGVTASRLAKYLEPELDDAGGTLLEPVTMHRRLWQLQHAELPASARSTIANTGVLTIGPGGDASWEQFRGFLMRLDTSAREAGAL